MLTVLAGLVLVLPGVCWALWVENKNTDPLEALANIVGVSISANALFALGFFLLDIRLDFWGLLGIAAFWLAVAVFGGIKRRYVKLDLRWLLAVLGFVAVIIWRLWQARSLLVPAWVDSLHHVLIVRKMLEAGGLMANLHPYLDVPFYYHYAFHSIAAQFAALSGLPPANAVLIIGQVLNASIGLSVYALGKALFKDWRLALIAGLLVTFVSKMPAYYLSWGRYTLTVGMILLPLAMASALKLLNIKESDRRQALLLALLTAGTILAHYFTALLLAFYLVILAISWLIKTRLKPKHQWQPMLRVLFGSLVGLALALPWIWRVVRFSNLNLGIDTNFPAIVEGSFSNPDQWQYLWYLLGEKSGYILLGMGLIGWTLLLVRPGQRAFALWTGLLAVLAMPLGLSLSTFRYDHFTIILFLPIALLAAYALINGVQLLDKVIRQKNFTWAAGILVIGLFLGWGAYETYDCINPRTVFTTQADLDAIAWIDENIPQEARFFINTTSWGYGISRGVDGGAWILPITGRWTLTPTLFYTFAIDQSVIEQNVDWGNRAQAILNCDTDFWTLMNDAQLSHVYLRQGSGRLTTDLLAGCEGLKEVYDASGVTIFEIKP